MSTSGRGVGGWSLIPPSRGDWFQADPDKTWMREMREEWGAIFEQHGEDMCEHLVDEATLQALTCHVRAEKSPSSVPLASRAIATAVATSSVRT